MAEAGAHWKSLGRMRALRSHPVQIPMPLIFEPPRISTTVPEPIATVFNRSWEAVLDVAMNFDVPAIVRKIPLSKMALSSVARFVMRVMDVSQRLKPA